MAEHGSAPRLLDGRTAKYWRRRLELGFWFSAAAAGATLLALDRFHGAPIYEQVVGPLSMIVLVGLAIVEAWVAAQALRAGLRERRAGYTTAYPTDAQPVAA